MRPKFYLIERAEPNLPSAQSYLVRAGQEYDASLECSRCGGISWSKCTDYRPLIQGFDDLLEIDVNERGFISSGMPPLIASRQNTELIARHLTGAMATWVGYSVWNQEAGSVDEANRFTRLPLLGALVVVSTCDEALALEGNTIQKCPACGTLMSFDLADYEPQTLFPCYSSWPGTDFFIIGGLTPGFSCITEDGVAKLANLGFTNLELTEWTWA